MTTRAASTVSFGLGLTIAGWRLGWPELTAIGCAALCLAVLALALAGHRPKARLTSAGVPSMVTRGDDASARLTVHARSRRRWMRIAEGRVATPVRTVQVPSRPYGQAVTLTIPLDTTRRGEHNVGPYALVHGDPWSMSRRVLDRTRATTFTVLPRTYPFPRHVITGASVENTMLSSRRPGDHHFHALRDYVLGDEPRMVHWRSSARAGHLVVRQEVMAATSGTTVVLDCDRTAYGSDERFGAGWIDDRFEAAVEIAASVVAADLGRNERVELRSTIRGRPSVVAAGGHALPCLEALATIPAVAPAETEPEHLPTLVRRSRSARFVLVTGTPRPATIDAAQRIRRSGVRVLVIRVGSRGRADASGLPLLDVDHPADLATCPH